MMMDNPVDTAKRTLIYETESPATEILQHIDEIRSLDRESERSQTYAGFGCLAGFLIAGGSLAASLILGTQASGRIPILGPIGVVVGLVVLACGAIVYFASRKSNLPNRRYELLARTVDMVRRDMATDAPLAVHVSFRSPTERSKFIRKDKIGVWDASFYEDPWFSLRGRFLDGTTFWLELVELSQVRSRWKRSRSGKMKHKSKTKTSTVTNLRLKSKPEKYPNLESFGQLASEHIMLPEWCTVKRLQVTNSLMSLRVVAKTLEEWEVPAANEQARFNGAQMVAMMFLSLYRVLNLCKGEGANQA